MRENSDRFRRGVTLIEIMIGSAVVAIVFSLFLPALVFIRESARRAQCVNNLRQMAHAALQYHDQYDRLPYAANMPYAKPATTPSLTDASGIPPGEMLRDILGPVIDSPTRRSSDPRYPFGPNWAVSLLPYLGEAALYAQAKTSDFDAGTKNGNATQRDFWRTVVKDKVLAVYRCPSDDPKTTYDGLPDCPGPWARGNYAANAGPGWWQMSLRGGYYQEAYGLTGPVMGINYGAHIPSIPDGKGTTILFNEVRSGVASTDPRGVWAMGYPGSSVTASNAIGDCTTPNDRGEGSDDIDGCPHFYYKGIGTRDRIGCATGFLNLGWPSWQAQARSQHKNGVHAAFCDGSVRFVHDYVAQAVWFSMLSARDGVPYQFD